MLVLQRPPQGLALALKEEKEMKKEKEKKERGSAMRCDARGGEGG